MENEFDLISLEEIQARADAATPGDWTVYEDKYRVLTGEEWIELRIGTVWDHPQLHGPSAIVTVGYSCTPEEKPQATVSMSREDAEFIAHARRS